jgi:vacuolar-type H+-ATPase subunit I/STV1
MINYTQDELIRLCAAIEKLNKMDKRFLVDYGYDNAVEIANSLETDMSSDGNSKIVVNLTSKFAKKIDNINKLHTQQLEVILEGSKKINLKCAELVKNYNELIYAVGRKYPNETRHQTALRYILNSEKEDITNYADVRKP